jgi:serine/threonine-protein kinase
VADADGSGALRVGDVLGERFEILAHLGQGGMGAVLACLDRQTGKKVALKLMRSVLASDERLVERFKREARVLEAIDHPAVVGVEEAGTLPDGTHFIAMELLEGETLKDFLKSQGRMALELLLPIVGGLAGALAAAHEQGVIHRDIKPSNIFLPARPAISLSTPEGSELVKLVDFGVAKMSGERKLTQLGDVVGTYRYTSPEQLIGIEADARADIYSLGVVMYEALAGEPPFPSGTFSTVVEAIVKGAYRPLRELVPDLDPQIEAVIAKAMATDREKRFSTARELSEAFTRAYVKRSLEPRPLDPHGSQRPTLPGKPAVDPDARTLTDAQGGRSASEMAMENAIRSPRASLGAVILLVVLVLLAIAGAVLAW